MGRIFPSRRPVEITNRHDRLRSEKDTLKKTYKGPLLHKKRQRHIRILYTLQRTYGLKEEQDRTHIIPYFSVKVSPLRIISPTKRKKLDQRRNYLGKADWLLKKTTVLLPYYPASVRSIYFGYS